MHLFIELLTLVCFLALVVHAWVMRGRQGLELFAAMLFLGLVRENFVIVYRFLYSFAPLSLMLGKAPLISSIIWGFSIYAAVTWTEGITGERLDARRPRPSNRFLALAALFMLALACFYEPFLKLIRMARWEEGTRTVLDVPLIALIGYPTLTVLFLLVWCHIWHRFPRPMPRGTALVLTLIPLAVLHALSLQELKTFLGW